MTDIIRHENHETDTAARRIVPLLLPRAWEHREPGGRDYGIDMEVEIFDAGRVTGRIALLQLKGTTKTINRADPIVFDLPVKTLKYAEMFVVPFLCVLCPVQTEPPCAYFVWLQDYIKAVLDFENPAWRENTSTVRIIFSLENCLPDAHAKLSWVAGEPQRVRDWTRLAWLHREIRWALDGLDVRDFEPSVTKSQAGRALVLVTQVRCLRSLFQHPSGFWLDQHATTLERLLELLGRGAPYKLKDVKFLGAVDSVPEGCHISEEDLAAYLISNHLQTTTDGMMAAFAQYFDEGLKRAGDLSTPAYFDPKRSLQRSAHPGESPAKELE